MRVVSMVPSWTETLLRAGVNVVGRTRFCVHPAEAVKGLPVIGGTKDLKAEDLASLRPDLVILDREENPKDFVARIAAPILDTHVDSVATLAAEFRRLADTLKSPLLRAEAERAERLRDAPPRRSPPSRIPGLLEELTPWDPRQEVIYVIWKNPWMAAGAGTYIDDVLGRLGFRRKKGAPGRYPTLEEAEFKDAYALFSSEPFPFAKRAEDLRAEGRAGAIVDGEGFSWFGSRGLDFLEAASRE